MSTLLIKDATLINEGRSFKGSVLINNKFISKVFTKGEPLPDADKEYDAEGLWLLPGVIDDQVHFREPGLTHKGSIASESVAAVAGGVTSFMDMPNTMPQTVTIGELEKKYELASGQSMANYSFYLGATNDNLRELLKADPSKVCGIKVFMGSSTGNMLVDNKEALIELFKEVPLLIATHCEDETIIRENTELYRQKYGEDIAFKYHPQIRSAEACYKSSSLAVELASKYNSRLHVLHLSTEKELSLFSSNKALADKRISAEVCVHHLWFTQDDYDRLGSRIKWNPAVKSLSDREALREALNNNLLDVVATDHAPHTLDEKSRGYFNAPSGGPLVQHSLLAMLEMAGQGVFTKELVVDKMCHAPATLFRIEKRGYIRENYYADLVLIDPNAKEEVKDSNALYKCGWTPFAGNTFNHSVKATWVNGNLVYNNGSLISGSRGMRLTFATSV